MMTALAALIGALLYRLRGGWWKTLTGGGRWWNGTHACRAIWAAPTGLLIYFLAGGPWWLAVALVVSVFLSMALIGHGAHMIMDAEMMALGTFEKTELLTRWLPKVLGGEPNQEWLDDGDASDVIFYNVVGMSFIGAVRNALAILPLLILAPVPAVLYVLTGLLHGPLYWVGWQASEDITVPELLVGAVSWASIVAILGGSL